MGSGARPGYQYSSILNELAIEHQLLRDLAIKVMAVQFDLIAMLQAAWE